MENLFMRDGDFVVKTLNTAGEIIQSYELRHLIFSETLHWVDESPNRMEIDEYDRFAIPIGVFREDRILAYIRFVLSKDYYMIEKNFRMLVRNEYDIKKTADTGETSRFCVHPGARVEKVSGYNVFMFLFKGLYTWCCMNDIRYIHTVVEEKINRLLCAKGFPCSPMGDTITMNDGTVALAVTVDWRRFEIQNRIKRPGLVDWFQINSSEMAVATA